MQNNNFFSKHSNLPILLLVLLVVIGLSISIMVTIQADAGVPSTTASAGQY